MNKKSIYLVIFLIFALFLSGCGSSGIVTPTTEEAKIKSVIHEYALALNDQNWNKARSYCVYGSEPYYSVGLKEDDLKTPNKVVQLGVPPIRIDIITSISGVTWEEADASKEPGLFGDVSVSYIGKEQFIINKRATGRKKDLADLESLGEE